MRVLPVALGRLALTSPLFLSFSCDDSSSGMENETFQLNPTALESDAVHFEFTFQVRHFCCFTLLLFSPYGSSQSLVSSLQGKLSSIKCPSDETIAILKQRLYDMTNVMPIRQKLLGLKPIAGSPVPVSDDAPVSRFCKPGSKTKFMLMGTPEAQVCSLLRRNRVAGFSVLSLVCRFPRSQVIEE